VLRGARAAPQVRPLLARLQATLLAAGGALVLGSGLLLSLVLAGADADGVYGAPRAVGDDFFSLPTTYSFDIEILKLLSEAPPARSIAQRVPCPGSAAPRASCLGVAPPWPSPLPRQDLDRTRAC